MSLAEAKTKRTIVERRKRLIELWNLFDVVQSRIEVLENQDSSNKNKDELCAQHEQHRANFESIYFSWISRCESLLEHFDQRNLRISSIP